MSEYFLHEGIKFQNPNENEDEAKLDQLRYRSMMTIPEFSDHFNHSLDLPCVSVSYTGGSDNSMLCPVKPMVLCKTHFTIESSTLHELCDSSLLDKRSKFDKIVRMIDAYLAYFCFYDFTFAAQASFPPMWQGKYIQGSQSCELDIHIYSDDGQEENYIIEANRVKGDAKPFHSFYKEFLSLVLNLSEEVCHNQFEASPLPVARLTESQFQQAVSPIFKMTMSPYFDARLEASKMLCDLIMHNHEHLQVKDFVTTCLAHLEVLLVDYFDDVRQHAIVAFASLVNIPCYQAEMVRSTALPLIFSMIENVVEARFDSIQVRRESASVLAALSRYDPQGVVDNIEGGGMMVQEWANRVEQLKCDPALYSSAIEIKENLSKILAAEVSPCL